MIVPVSAPAIAVWEYGGVGLVVFLIINLFSLVLINTVFMSRNVIARSLGVSLLGLPTAELFIGPPSLMVQLALRLILYLAVVAVVMLGWRLLWSKNSARRFAVSEGDALSTAKPNSAPG